MASKPSPAIDICYEWKYVYQRLFASWLVYRKKQELSKLDTGLGIGNFYLKPNGVFYITANGRSEIVTKDLNIRNGVGILPNAQVVLVMSEKK